MRGSTVHIFLGGVTTEDESSCGTLPRAEAPGTHRDGITCERRARKRNGLAVYSKVPLV